MKRGLVLESTELYPREEWGGRLERVQDELGRLGADWALVYGDVSAADDIAYLVNVCVYWNEGVLAVPQVGEPVFVTKLSPRVFPWMERTSTIGGFRSGPDIAKNLSAIVGTEGRIAVVDDVRWPAALLDDVTVAFDGRTAPAPGLISWFRATPSDTEIVMLIETGARLGEALAAEPSIAAAELAMRTYGCTDVLLDHHGTAIEILVQYGPLWLRAGRDSGPLSEAATAALGQAAAMLRPGSTANGLAQAITTPEGTRVDLTLVSSLQFTGPGELSETVTTDAGTVVAIVVDLIGTDAAASVSDTFLVTADGARPLTAQNGEL